MSVRIVYIRRNSNGQLERSEDKKAWSATGILPEPLLKVLKDLAYKEYHAQLKTQLSLEVLRRDGQTLWKGLFGASDRTDYGSRIHLVPVLGPEPVDNDHLIDLVCTLPWQLMTRGSTGNFLSRDRIKPVVVTFDAAPARGQGELFEHIRFPDYPEIAMIIPQLTTRAKKRDIEAAAHREALKQKLEEHYKSPEQRSLLHFFTRFDELGEYLENMTSSPKLIYFYGHGTAAANQTQLLFDGPTGKDDWRNIDDLRILLDSVVQRTMFPPVAWINACNAGVAELNSAVRVLSGACCSVVAARTIAYVEDSRKIAEEAVPAIAIQGHAPASALRDALIRKPLEVSLARWANTVVSVQYSQWSALAPEKRGTEDIASLGDFSMRVDRSDPLDKAKAYLKSEIVKNPAQPLPLAWRGTHADSLEVFEQRLSDTIQEHFFEYPVTIWRVDLNPANGPKLDEQKDPYPNRFFTECLIHSLDPLLKGEPLAGNRESELLDLFENRFGDGPAVVVFEHGPLSRSLHRRIAAYRAYWDGLAQALQLGGEKRVYIVLGFSIDDSSFVEDEDVELSPDLRLGMVSPREVTEHYQQFGEYYGIRGDKLIGQTVARLMELSGGAFRPIHEELEKSLSVNFWSQKMKEGQ